MKSFGWLLALVVAGCGAVHQVGTENTSVEPLGSATCPASSCTNDSPSGACPDQMICVQQSATNSAGNGCFWTACSNNICRTSDCTTNADCPMADTRPGYCVQETLASCTYKRCVYADPGTTDSPN